MTEAVIVATARSPIGRAMKGSLDRLRPDDMAAQIVRALMDKVPEVQARRRGPDHGLRPAGRRGRVQHRPHGGRSGRARRRPGRDGQPLLLVVAADDPHGRPCDQGRRGRLFISAGVEAVSRYGNGRGRHRPQPDLRRGRGAHGGARRGRPARPGRRPTGLPDFYIAMGQTAENVREIENVTREEMDEFGARSQQRAAAAVEQRLLRERDHPAHPARRHASCRPTTAHATAPPPRSSPGSSRCSAPTARSPPATPAPSTTARRP